MGSDRDHPLADHMTPITPTTPVDRGAGDGQRRFLPTLDDAAPEPSVSEAYGGSGDAPSEPIDAQAVRERLVEALKTIYDPEIPVNIHDLGLIYGLEVDAGGRAEIEMTLTAPGCPVAGWIVEEVARKTGEVEGVSTSHVTLTWEPPWSQDRMTDEAKLELGLL
jgi:FeS assembly SUF system protein